MTKTDFFEGHNYRIHEKSKWFKFQNVYNVLSETGENLGTVKQRMTGGQKIRQFLLGKFRSLAPFKLEILNPEDKLYATISRGWNFNKGVITITDANTYTVGLIRNKSKLFKLRFTIEDATGMQIAEISSDKKRNDFSINDVNNFPMGEISKKWNGLVKEINFINQYHVTVNPAYSKHKVIIFSAAITLDMTLRNR